MPDYQPVRLGRLVEQGCTKWERLRTEHNLRQLNQIRRLSNLRNRVPTFKRGAHPLWCGEEQMRKFVRESARLLPSDAHLGIIAKPSPSIAPRKVNGIRP